MNESYKSGVLIIDKDWLQFPGNSTALKLSQITDMDVIWNPKRKILIQIIIWYILVRVMNTLQTDSLWVYLLFFFILFGGISYIIDSIKFNLKEATTALQISMSSGKIVLLHSKNRLFLERIKNTILKAIKTKEEKIEINLNNFGIINIGKKIDMR